ncbi:MAG: GNAT family N-acetyltransferase [Bacteroidota bacterium]
MEAIMQQASVDDLAIVRQIAHITWPVAYGEMISHGQLTYMLDMMYSVESLRQQVEERGHIFNILHEAGEPVGFVSHEFDYLPGTTKIHKLYALPNRQGKGYGRLMVDHVSSIAGAAGQQVLRLDVNRKNVAIGFYKKLGFKVVDQVDTDIGQGYLMEDYVMERPL